jgi:hypothetical protein
LVRGLTHEAALACWLSFSILDARVGAPASADRFRFTPVSGKFLGVADALVVLVRKSHRGCVTDAGVFRDRRTRTVDSGVSVDGVSFDGTSERRVFVTA